MILTDSPKIRCSWEESSDGREREQRSEAYRKQIGTLNKYVRFNTRSRGRKEVATYIKHVPAAHED